MPTGAVDPAECTCKLGLGGADAGIAELCCCGRGAAVGNKPNTIVFAAGGACVCASVSSGPAVCARRDERNAIVCGDRRGVSGVKTQDRGVIELVRASRREAVGVVRASALTAVSPEHVERVGARRGGAEEVVPAFQGSRWVVRASTGLYSLLVTP